MTIKQGETTTPPAVAETGFQAGVGDSVTVPVDPAPPANSATDPAPQDTAGKQFTAEDLERARREEKDKVYGRLDKLQEQVAEFERARAEQEEANRLAAEADAAARREAELEELSAKDAVKRIEDELTAKITDVTSSYEARLAAIQDEMAAKDALLEREQQRQVLESHKARLLAEHSASIAPELVDLVSGNTPEELEQSISSLVAKTDAIMNNIQQALPQQRLRGVPATGASTLGPAETQAEQQTYTAEDIRDMSMDDYNKVRDRLLSAASRR